MKKIPNPVDVHVGSRVRMRRILIGMSQEKLGDALGLTFQQVQKYEKGTNRIGASRLQHISTILGVPVEYFFDGKPMDETTPMLDMADGSPDEATYVVDFLATSEGVQLNKAFVRIRDARLRRKVVELVKEIAGAPEEAA
ncbi:MAG: helix-turn-helix transcriptional regulator [Beijerinckiaceae bacterium]|nr:helix-turn-helix transcriptional regulator [Beijerinckiaceae bacterium]